MYPVLGDDSIGTVSSAFATWCLLLEVIVVEDMTGTWLTMLDGMCSAPSSWRSSLTATSIYCNLLVDTV